VWVEIGSGETLGYCGKLFADFGAEVIKVEPPGGDPMRRVAPLADAGDGRRESLLFAWLNTNKRSITADLDKADDIARIRALLATSDLLLDARHPDVIEASPLSHARLRADDPGLAITAISWFGESGPYRNYQATESVCRSLAGLVKLVGPVEGPPVLGRDGQVGVIGGLTAFIPSLAGLYGHAHGARRFAVSNLEAMLQVSEFDTGLALESGFSRPRAGINRFGRGYPSGNFQTRHGWLGVTVVTPAQWAAFCEMLDMPELAAEPRYAATIGRFIHADELKAIITPALLKHTALEGFERGIALRIPLAIVPDMQEFGVRRCIAAGAFGRSTSARASFEGAGARPHISYPATAEAERARAASPAKRRSNHLPKHARQDARAATRAGCAAAQGPARHRPHHGRARADRDAAYGATSAPDDNKVSSCQYPTDRFRGTDPRPPYH